MSADVDTTFIFEEDCCRQIMQNSSEVQVMFSCNRITKTISSIAKRNESVVRFPQKPMPEFKNMQYALSNFLGLFLR